MSKKEQFRLNDDTQRKINEQYSSSDGKRVRKVKVKSADLPYDEPQVSYKSKRKSLKKSFRRKPEPYLEEEPYYAEAVYEESSMRKKHRVRKLIVVTAIVCVVVILLNIVFFYYRGQIWFNEPRKRDYPVRGAAVDSGLGKIDWEIFSQNTISFVYVRATKGTTSIDEQFSSNRKGAEKTDLLVGCYHEFEFGSDGEKQAENFIEQCGDLGGNLRPMVKVTTYGIYNIHMKSAEDVKENLTEFLEAIKEEYGRNCVIMCDSACYEKYIEPYFDDYSLWIMSHFSEPNEESNWALWEFNPRTRTNGYENSKKYFALTVYRKDKDLENFKKNFVME